MRKKRYTLKRISSDASLKHHLQLASQIMVELNSAISLSVYLLIKYEEWEQIVEKDVSPFDYNDHEQFKDDYQAVSLLRKLENLPTGIDKERVAFEKFMAAEEQCKTYNELPPVREDPSKFNRDRVTLHFEAARKITFLLGKVPDMSDLNFSFGNGASSTCKGTAVNFADKLKANPESTPLAATHVKRIWKDRDALAYSLFDPVVNEEGTVTQVRNINIVYHNKLSFVPKTAKTDRAICVEPNLNIPFQRGIGQYIRSRLKLWDIKLQEQQQLHRELVKEGSKDGSFATIDLSAASDTVSYKLIWDLLPIEWASLLNDFRSPYTMLPDGTLHENQKFSSMGNGFTFELETMIFSSIVKTVYKRVEDENEKFVGPMPSWWKPLGRWSVYGDDIIVDTRLAQDVIYALELSGLKVNKDKTFISGNFLESCGSDSFLGHDCRPIFFKRRIENEKDFITVCNSISTMAGVDFNQRFRHKRFKKSWTLAVRRVPKRLKLFGPKQLGDTVIYDTKRPRSSHKIYVSNGVQRVKTVIPVLDKVQIGYNLPSQKVRRLEAEGKPHTWTSTSKYSEDIIVAAALMQSPEYAPLKARITRASVQLTAIQNWSAYYGAWI